MSIAPPMSIDYAQRYTHNTLCRFPDTCRFPLPSTSDTEKLLGTTLNVVPCRGGVLIRRRGASAGAADCGTLRLNAPLGWARSQPDYLWEGAAHMRRVERPQAPRLEWP
jgi:hypothetical protein